MEVKWPELAEEIRKLFNEYIPDKPLTEQQLRSIALHLHKGIYYYIILFMELINSVYVIYSI